MVAPRPQSPERKPSLPLATFAAGALAALVLMGLPASADHPQTVVKPEGTFDIQFDHGGDNPWWVEVEVRPLNGDFVAGVSVQVEDEQGMTAMQAQSNTWERSQAGWRKYATSYPYDPVHVPAGKRVMFFASVSDAGGGSAQVASCWFTHPAGVEQCGSSSTTTTSGSGFDAPFTGFRGNEWWVQAKVGSNGPAIAKVDVRIAPDGAWKPLTKQTWNTAPASWAGSYHFPQGSVLQMRATAVDGQTDLGSCRQWIPAAGTDAAIVACPGTSSSSSSSSTSTGPTAFDATFSNVRGNEYWAEAVIKANGPIFAVLMKNCSTSEEEYDMVYHADWGKWTLGRHIPDGSKVYMTAIGEGGNDSSGTYIWPSATPSTPC